MLNRNRLSPAKFLLLLLPLLAAQGLRAQRNLLLDRDVQNAFEAALNSRFVDVHTAVKPMLENSISALRDSVTGIYYTGTTKPAFSRKQYRDGKSETAKGLIEITPLCDLRAGYDLAGKQPIYTTFGALRFNGYYKEKLAWDVRYGSGYTTLPAYLDSFVATHHVIPGWGDRAYASKGEAYTWQNATGYVSWSPNHIFNIQAGRDKHFWGDGYRSLFLSDVSGSYPFLKLSTHIWKLQYTSLFAVQSDMTAASGVKADFRKKYGTFHYLSWNATKRWNFSVFEAVVWQGEDNNRFRGFDPNYLNPMLFFRPVEYSLGSSDNAMLGFAFKVKAAHALQFYGQLILDEFYLKEIKAHNQWWANKQGGQIGFKGFNLFTVKRLNIQGEVNIVRPYTYAHGSVQQNYGNANQSLAHPQGANFAEAVGILNYRWRHWLVEGKLLWARYGADSAGVDYGHNIYISYLNHPKTYGNTLFQGIQTDLAQADFRVAYLLYAPLNLKLEGGVTSRVEKTPAKTDKNMYVWLGFRTALFNDYRDY